MGSGTRPQAASRSGCSVRSATRWSVRLKVVDGGCRGMRHLAAGLNQAVQEACGGCGTRAEGPFRVLAGASGRRGALCGWRHGGEHLGHVGVDGLLAGCGGYGYPVVAVVDEMQAAD